MRTLFDRLSRENQAKLFENELAKYYAENRLMKMHYVNEVSIDCASQVYYVLTGINEISVPAFYRLFDN